MKTTDYYKDLPYTTLERCGFSSNYHMLNFDQKELMDTITAAIAEKFLGEILSLQEELEDINWDLEDYKCKLENLESRIKEAVPNK